VTWDGADDFGEKALPGTYKIRLTARGDGKQSTDISKEIKIVRVGVVALAFKNVYPLKFAFKQYPAKFDADDFEIPAEQWKLKALDSGSKTTARPLAVGRARVPTPPPIVIPSPRR